MGFKKRVGGELMLLKQKHQDFVKIQNNLVFGGVTLRKDESTKSLLYILEASSKAKALIFLKQDPYFCLADKIKIESFIQKLPKHTNDE